MTEIDIGTVAKAYARWAPVYDFVFGELVFSPRFMWLSAKKEKTLPFPVKAGGLPDRRHGL